MKPTKRQQSLAEKVSGVSLGERPFAILGVYLDDKRTQEFLDSYADFESDAERFCVVRSYGADSFRETIDRLDIHDLGLFLGYNTSGLAVMTGVGRGKALEFKLVQGLFANALGKSRGPRPVAKKRPSPKARPAYIPTPDDLLRADEHIPPFRIIELSVRSRHTLAKLGVPLTPRGICTIERDAVMAIQRAGEKVAGELATLRARCIDGTVWSNDETSPSNYESLADYILDLEARLSQLRKATRKIARAVLHDYMGLLNVESRTTLQACGKKLGMTRERIRQMSNKLKAALFGPSTMALHGELVACVKRLFEQAGGTLSSDDLVRGVEAEFGWKGTTRFSLLKLLTEYLRLPIKADAGGILRLG